MTRAATAGASRAAREPLVRRVPWYPVVLTTAFVVNLYVETGVSHFAALRPLFVAVALTITVLAVSSVVVRNRHLGGLLTGLIVIVMAGWRSPLLLSLVLVLCAFAALLLPRTRWARNITWPGVTRALNITSLLLFAGIGLKIIQLGTAEAFLVDMRQGGPLIEEATTPAEDEPPDIYMVMLDGYPRADVLARSYGTDNSDFIGGLRERGFDVAEHNRSNYSLTVLTLSSMFNMRLLDDVAAVRPRLGTADRDQPLLRMLINGSSSLGLLRSKGYEIAATSSGFEGSVLRQADVYLDSGELNEFEVGLLRATPISWLLELSGWDIVGDQQRSRILHAFDQLHELAATPSSRPRFAFVHIPAPHAPMVFGAHGSPVPVDLDDPYSYGNIPKDERDGFVSRYRGGVDYLNGLVLKAVDDLITSSRPGRDPVVIIFSDHGPRTNLDDDAQVRLTERVSNFFAARLPGHDGLFPDEVTPANVLPTLFDAYLGTHLPRSLDRNLISAGTTVFELTEIPNVDASASP